MLSLCSVTLDKAEFLITVKSGEGDGTLGLMEKAMLGKVGVKVVLKHFCDWGRWNETSVSPGAGGQRKPAFCVLKYFGLLTSRSLFGVFCGWK